VKPYLEKPFTKKGWWRAQGVGQYNSSPVPQKKKKKIAFGCIYNLQFFFLILKEHHIL
jgi:hypothetical protein